MPPTRHRPAWAPPPHAARSAAAALGVGDLDAIIGASTGPQQAIPCTAALVQRELTRARWQKRLL